MAFGRSIDNRMDEHFVGRAREMVPEVSRGMAVVYILRLGSGVLYVGCTSDCESRLAEHAAGTAGRTTRLDPPVELLWLEEQADFVSARRREGQIKKWSRAKKLALVTGDFDRLRALSRSRS